MILAGRVTVESIDVTHHTAVAGYVAWRAHRPR